MVLEDLIGKFETDLKMVVDKLKDELGMIRSNRPSVEILENIKVNVYDQMMTVQQLGSISIQPPRDLLISIWDKNAVGAVVKAIEDAKIGLTVSNDGNVIRAFLPVLTDERKSELSKLVKKTSENFRIQVRSRRDEVMKRVKSLKEDGEINEDQEFKLKDKLQEKVEGANKGIEDMVARKLEEIQG